MPDNIEREIGSLTARMEGVEEALKAMSHDVRGMRDDILKAKGGWTAIGIISMIAGSIGALVTKIIPFAAVLVK